MLAWNANKEKHARQCPTIASELDNHFRVGSLFAVKTAVFPMRSREILITKGTYKLQREHAYAAHDFTPCTLRHRRS